MKVLAASLAVLLLVATCSQAEVDPGDNRTAALSTIGAPFNNCCYTYISRPIPRRTIQSAYWTSSSCSMPAVILVTRKGKQICADPKAPWVQEYLQHLELLEH